jgi:hypothetical protein
MRRLGISVVSIAALLLVAIPAGGASWQPTQVVEVNRAAALAAGPGSVVWVASFSQSSHGVLYQLKQESGNFTAMAVANILGAPTQVLPSGTNQLWVLDNSNGTSPGTLQDVENVSGAWEIVAAIPTGISPRQIALAPDGSVWIANAVSSTLQHVSKVGGAWTTVQTLAMQKDGKALEPTGVTIGLDGTVWATLNDGTVDQVIPSSNGYALGISFYAGCNPDCTYPGLGSIMSMATSTNGSIWWLNSQMNTAQFLSDSNGTWTESTQVKTGNRPETIVAATDGSVWVGNAVDQSVQQFENTSSGWALHASLTLVNSPTGSEVDFAPTTSNVIWIITSPGIARYSDQVATATTTMKKPKRRAITCVKGKLVKRVVAVKPICPKGYHKRA